MKNIIIITSLCVLGMAQDASAYVKNYCRFSNKSSYSSNVYVSGGLIYAPTINIEDSEDSINLDSGYGLRLAYGVKLNQFRIEGAIKYVDGAEYKKSIIESDGYMFYTEKVNIKDTQFGAMLNVYYDINIIGNISLFLGGGVGVVYNDVEAKVTTNVGYSATENFKDTLLAGQFGGGISYGITPKTNLDFGYRYGITTQTDYDANIASHEITLGARYTF